MRILLPAPVLLFAFFSSGIYAQSVTFNYTGVAQTYTVPACVNSITVDVRGAEGSPAGSGGPSIAGKGGRVQATLPVTPGQVLNMYVGQKPPSDTGGWNGGGMGGTNAGGGGGASDIRQNGIALSNRVIIAGGGGGGGFDPNTGYIGGHGGGSGTAGNGTSGTYGGHGGTQTAGGAPGTGNVNGTAGSSGTGGNGASSSGGGGGGGYFGGGGGGQSIWLGGGGGGGSSYTASGVTGITHSQGFQTGNGQIIITPIVSTGSPATPGAITGINSVCAGASETYSITAVPNATSYSWMVPAGTTIDSGQGSTTLFVTFGNTSGNISITASNSCGTSSASTFSVTVNAPPVPAINSNGPTTFCLGDSVILSSDMAANYMWSNGSTDQSISVTSSGSYSVTITDGNGCSAVSASTTVTVNPLPNVSFTGLMLDYCTYSPSSALSGTPAGGIFSGPGITGNSFDPAMAGTGTWTITYSYTDANNCSNTSDLTVNVYLCTGVADEQGSMDVIVFPNPTNGIFHISILQPSGEPLKMELFTLYGQLVYSSAIIQPGGEQVDVSGLERGIYFLKISDGNRLRVQKIILR
ncbi:MAG TPA: T9SS type A sorting domain-containing protein [Bacteroidia bacterium]|nr:T9SS type A sorting domain-containing protein [Bacteroidia bacterium]